MNVDGTLNRAALAKTVFEKGAEEKLDALNKITHKYVLGKAREMIADFEKIGCPAVIVDAPALYESGFDKECDFSVAVLADKEIRIGRIMERDGLSHQAAAARINAQKPDDFYKERAKVVIYNNSDKSDLQIKAREIITALEEA